MRTIADKLNRIFLVVAVAVLFTIILISQAYLYLHGRAIEHENLSSQAVSLAGNLESAVAFGDAYFAQQTLNALQHQPEVFLAAVILPDGKPLATYAANRRVNEDDAIEKYLVRGDFVAVEKHGVIQSIAQQGGSPARLVIVASLEDLNREALLILVAGTGMCALILYAAHIVFRRMSGAVVSPVEDLASIMRTIEREGGRGQRALVVSNDEFGELATGFNAMLSSLEANSLRLNVELEERKRGEAETAAAKNQLQATLDAIPDLMFEVGLDGRYFDYHSPNTELLAAPIETLMRSKVSDVLPAESADVCMRALQEANDNGQSRGRQFALPLSQGTRWFELSVARKAVATGDEPRFVVLSRDITERKRLGDDVAEWRARYEAVIKASGLIMYDWNPVTDAVAYGGDVERILGYSAAEMAGGLVHWVGLIDPRDRDAFNREIKRVFGSKERFHQEYRVRRKDGWHVSVLDEGYFVLDAPGNILRMVGFVHDITERKQAEADRARFEAQLRESQKMEALGTMAGGVAHDFNNVLAMITGNVELARQDVGTAHPALVSLEEIGKASRRAKDLVQQILAFSRRQKLERKATSLALVVVESARLIRATLPMGVRLNVECKTDTPAVLADATQIKQILLNLCGNAAQALQDQGRPGTIDVSLSASDHTGGEAHGKLPSGRYACLTVRDDGPGMDEATRLRIFEPFYTTKPVGKGTGLGLAVVHGIVHAHDASIQVESAPGKGSEFRIYFPAIEAPVAEVAAPSPGVAPVQGAGKRVLYVDDEEAIIFLMTRLLERRGFRVSGFTDARDALAAVQANPGEFDLAVTDFNMPGMSGLDVANALREIRPDLPVVLASGYITEDLRQKAPAAGVRELIYKPNTVDDLCEAVARYANTQEGTRRSGSSN